MAGDETFYANIFRRAAATDTTADGEGRCGASGGFVSFRRVPRNPTGPELTACMRDSTGQEVLVPLELHRKAVAEAVKMAATQGLIWDGTVIDQLGVRHYMDERTVQGKLPIDCPNSLRQRIGNVLAEDRSNLRGEVAEMRLALALHARAKGYRISDEELRAERNRMAMDVIKKGPAGPAIVRTVSSLDQRAVEHLLSSTTAVVEYGSSFDDTPAETAAKVASAGAAGAPIIGFYDHAGKLHGLRGIIPGEGGLPAREVHIACNRAWSTELRYSLVLEKVLVDQRRRFDHSHAEGHRCATCEASRVLCSCPRDVKGLRRAIEDIADSVPKDAEHRWNRQHGVAPTEAMRARAHENTQAVAESMRAANPERAADIDGITAGTGFESIALYLEQTGAAAEVRAELLADPDVVSKFATVFERAAERVADIHSDYVRVLYAEFDADDAPMRDGKVDETYLGRDGIYAFYARQEMRREYARRHDTRATENSVKYLSVSTGAGWRRRDHKQLGDRPVLIDTGYNGTIPKTIAANQNLLLLEDDTVAPKQGEVAARLLRARSPGFGFGWQARDDSTIEAIEGEAKDTRSGRYVGDKMPAGALEQLVHRQVELCIRSTASEQIAALLDAERSNALDLDRNDFGTRRFAPKPKVAVNDQPMEATTLGMWDTPGSTGPQFPPSTTTANAAPWWHQSTEPF